MTHLRVIAHLASIIVRLNDVTIDIDSYMITPWAYYSYYSRITIEKQLGLKPRVVIN